MNPRILFYSLFVILASFGSSQKKAVTPSATSASERKQGYELRKQLAAQSLVKNLPFRNVGPTIMSGRVVDIEVDPGDPTHFYVAYASGGLWETKNEGTSFEPLFDQEIVMTIGDIAVDWKNNILYIGSGENNSSRSSYSGFGLFKSSDNGKTWTHLGLEDTHHIGRVICHPSDPNIIWVASLGHLYSPNENRGVFKTMDGGKTWEKTLFINARTGIIDLILNPENPNELFAASWERDRKAWNFEEAGPGSGLYQSKDGGSTWASVSGFPDTNGTGRIGLTYFPANPTILYAVIDNQDFQKKKEKDSIMTLSKDQLRSMTKEAFLALENDAINDFLDKENFPDEYNAPDLKEEVKSDKLKPSDLVTYLEDANTLLFDTPIKGSELYVSKDGGKTWTITHETPIESFTYSYGYYFGQVRTSGTDPDQVYLLGVPLIASEDGGKTWEMTTMENVHADHHALWVNPTRDGHLINGNDGGVNISYDNGKTWIKCNSVQVGQFYTVNFDMAEPYNLYGGLQDNGVWFGQKTYTYSRSWHEEGEYPYKQIMGGDGMQVAVDTRDNETVYTGYQFGNYFRMNTRTGETFPITPKHKLGEAPYRWNWQSPIHLSIHNQDIVYFGSNRFHRSLDQGTTFETLSGDLTNGGKKGDVAYGTLTTICESPKKFGLIYVGSDDGLIHVSKDAGYTWEKISGPLPSEMWVSRVTPSHHQEGRVYASLNGYRWDHFPALIYASENFGKSWTQIGTGLPKEPVNVIKEDPANENILYVGTDHGAYLSIDRGKTFMAFPGIPAVSVHDLVVHPRDKDLIFGTHGRSIYLAELEPVYWMIEKLDSGLAIGALEPITFSPKWGDRSEWYWSGFEEPEMEIMLFSKQGGLATFDVLDSAGIKLHSWTDTLEAGLNFATYDYSFSEEGASQPKGNGKYYLGDGTYSLKVSVNGTTKTQFFTIDPVLPKQKRKGSE